MPRARSNRATGPGVRIRERHGKRRRSGRWSSGRSGRRLHLSKLWGKDSAPSGKSLLRPEMPKVRNTYGTGVAMAHCEHGSSSIIRKVKAIR